MFQFLFGALWSLSIGCEVQLRPNLATIHLQSLLTSICNRFSLTHTLEGCWGRLFYSPSSKLLRHARTASHTLFPGGRDTRTRGCYHDTLLSCTAALTQPLCSHVIEAQSHPSYTRLREDGMEGASERVVLCEEGRLGEAGGVSGRMDGTLSHFLLL